MKENYIILDTIGNFCIKYSNIDNFISDPLHLRVGKEYNLNVVKEVKVTDEFLGLDEKVRKCSNDESFAVCMTKHYINNLIKKCKCLPFSIRSPYEVCNGMK